VAARLNVLLTMLGEFHLPPTAKAGEVLALDSVLGMVPDGAWRET
jgi:hypothetical protein